MSELPQMISRDGEIVRVLGAQDLLAAAGVPDPADAETRDLAQFVADVDHLASVGREAKQTVSDELVRRMDRRGKWTLHEQGVTIRAASPAAGTVAYDTLKLQDALAHLVEQGTIDAEAAEAALELVTPEPYLKQRPAGIKALVKLGGTAAALIASCEIPAQPARRAVKVTREPRS